MMIVKRSCFSITLLVLFVTLPLKISQAQTTSERSPSLKPGGFLQQQFIADDASDSPARFLIYRARVGVSGSVTDRIRVNVAGGYVEPPENTPRLVNAFVDFDIHPLLQVRTGQFLLPFGLEGPEVIIFNPAIERSLAVRRLNTFAMFRDIGVQLSGRHTFFNYAVALVNGEGANQAEQIEPKDVVGRLGFTPVDNLEMGVSGHAGQYQPDATTNYQARYRVGADLSISGGPLFFRSEYIIRQDDQPSGGYRRMHGGYALAGYEMIENLETIARYEYFAPVNSSREMTAITVGANYYFVGNTRLSVNYEYRDDYLVPDTGNILTVQMQVAL